MNAALRLLAAPSLATALLCATHVAHGQVARFEGWDAMRDGDFRFDPDHRTIRGFSVRAAASARAAFEDVEAALSAGDARLAAQGLMRIATGDPSAVIQVAGCDDCGEERARWVGAAEWALHQLAARIAPAVRADLASPEEAAAVRTATAWRDTEALRVLARRLEGLPEGRRAAESLARLAAERGEDDLAAAAAARALEHAPPEDAARDEQVASVARDGRALYARLLPGPPEPEPVLDLPTNLQIAWSRRHVIAELCDRPGGLNPFTATPPFGDARFAPIEPVVADGLVYLSDSLSVGALDLISGRELWRHAGPMQVLESLRDPEWFPLSTYATHQRPRAISPHLLSRPTLHGERVFVTVQTTERAHPLDNFDGYPINHPLPRRRLLALDRRTGHVLWTQERPSLDPDAFENRFDAAGPAVVGDGMVFVAGSVTEGSISAYLAAFDLDSGDLRWHSMLCSGQQELTMFNRPFQEHVISPPLLHDGVLYASTNLGIVGAVDAWSGRVRWLAAYDSIPRSTSRGVRPNNPRDVPWSNQQPFVESGTLFIAPLDSEWLLPLDPATGRKRFEPLRSRSGFERVLRQQAVPTGLGHVLVVTRDGVQVVDGATGSVRGPHEPFPAGDEISGVATRAGDAVLVPTQRRLLVLDPADGSVRDMRPWPLAAGSLRDVQRVTSAGAAVVMTDGDGIHAALNTEALRAELAASSESSPMAALALAELALGEGRFDEARDLFQGVLDGGAPSLLDRARSGRLEAALRRARLAHTSEAWDDVLHAAVTDDQLFEHAPEALASLAARGSRRDVGTWLQRLAARDPARLVPSGGEGSRPASFLQMVHALADAPPPEAVDLLQRLVQEHGDAVWEGASVADSVRRRLEALLAEHGRGLYARHEAAAANELAQGRALSEVEARYPVAEAVAAARVGRVEERLAAGDARGALDLSAGRGGPALLDARRRAAQALGETDYARRLAGEASAPRAVLTRLPADDSGRRTFALHERLQVDFPTVTGQADPGLRHLAFGCLDGAGEMFMIDTRAGELAWSGRALPGGLTQASSSVSSFHLEGDLLVAQGRGAFTALRLVDGSVAWQATLPGRTYEVVSVGGLLVALHLVGGQAFTVTALGTRTGAEMFRLELPDSIDPRLERVGETCVLLTRSAQRSSGRAREKRLLVLDIERGVIASSEAVHDEGALVATLDEPPTVLLSRRLDGVSGRSGPVTELRAFDPVAAAFRWSAELDVDLLSSERILDVGRGRFVVRASARRPESTRRVDRLLPCDVQAGPLPEPADGMLLELVQGQTRRPAPRIVLRDPVDADRLVLLEGASLSVLATLNLPAGTGGHLQVLHGLDGYVVVAEPLSGPSSVWIARDPPGGPVVMVRLDDLPQDMTKVRLVDDALLVASRGTVRLIRSTPP